MTVVAPLPLPAPQVRARWVGLAGAGAVVAASVAGTWLALGPGDRSLHGLMDDHVLINAVDGVEIGLIAAVLAWLRPGHRIGWLLLYVAGAESLAILGEGWALASYHVDLPGRVLMAWLGSWVWVGAMVVGPTVIPAIYPTGHAHGRTGRVVVRLGLACAFVVSACLALLDDAYRGVVQGHRLGHNPLSHGYAQLPVAVLAIAAAACAVGLAVFTLVWTLRRLRWAVSPEREQLAWLVAAVVPSTLVAAVASPGVSFVVNLLANFALVVGIVRYQMFDIKLVLRSGLLYGLLLGIAASGYFGIVALITLITPAGTVPSLFATATVALLTVPAYRLLAGRISRLVYGDRADPVRALSRLRDDDPAASDLETMVAAVAASVRSPHVAVVSAVGVRLAQTGAANGNPLDEVPLRHDGAQVGTLVVAWRTPADRFNATDRRVIEALATPVAVAVRAVRLSEELGESRARVIAVREGERRQLRNDLHDGLGPSLSGVALGIEAALKAGDAEAVRRILRVLHGEVAGLVGEVRSLIEDLGPAGLERGGLVTAVRAQAEAVRALGGLAVSVDAGELPVLPGPVEVAVYRVAAEALTNVVRHAEARQAWVKLRAHHGGLSLEVSDDGRGIGAAPEGVGRSSMAERIASVGGSLELTGRPGGGTLLRAAVPLGRTDA